ncbi:MAG TPA: hypothetical protein VF510_01100 [Ktedonobacterales bacterium]
MATEHLRTVLNVLLLVASLGIGFVGVLALAQRRQPMWLGLSCLIVSAIEIGIWLVVKFALG